MMRGEERGGGRDMGPRGGLEKNHLSLRQEKEKPLSNICEEASCTGKNVYLSWGRRDFGDKSIPSHREEEHPFSKIQRGKNSTEQRGGEVNIS